MHGGSGGKLEIIDIYPGRSGTSPVNLIELNGVVMFGLYDRNRGQLWRSDGTPEGTWMVKDICPTGGANILNTLVVNGILFFSAQDGINGQELWRSDGTPDGTWMVKDINPGSSSSEVKDLVSFSGLLYFSAYDPVNGWELWRSDGTESGTWLVKDIIPGENGSHPKNFKELKGFLYFVALTPNYNSEIWRTDGTTLGTTWFSEFRPQGEFFSFDGEYLYFSNYNDTHYNYALARIDGTPSGTQELDGIGLYGDEPMVQFKDSILFPGQVNYSPGLCRISMDGSNPMILADTTYSYPHLELFQQIGDQFFFVFDEGTAMGQELWKTDGTVAGTRQVLNMSPGEDEGTFFKNLASFEGNLFFHGAPSGNAWELWRICSEPAVQISAPGSQCFGQQNLLATVTDSGQLASYHWTVSGAEIMDGQDSPNLNLLSSGFQVIQLQVEVEVLGSCSSTGYQIIPAYPVQLGNWYDPALYQPEDDRDQNGRINILDYVDMANHCSSRFMNNSQ